MDVGALLKASAEETAAENADVSAAGEEGAASDTGSKGAEEGAAAGEASKKKQTNSIADTLREAGAEVAAEASDAACRHL